MSLPPDDLLPSPPDAFLHARHMGLSTTRSSRFVSNSWWPWLTSIPWQHAHQLWRPWGKIATDHTYLDISICICCRLHCSVFCVFPFYNLSLPFVLFTIRLFFFSFPVHNITKWLRRGELSVCLSMCVCVSVSVYVSVCMSDMGDKYCNAFCFSQRALQRAYWPGTARRLIF